MASGQDSGGSPMSKRQFERSQFGGMSLNEVLGGEKNYLGALGAYNGDYSSAQAGGSWDSTVAAWRADNPTYMQRVEVQGQSWSAEQKLASWFPGSDSMLLNSTEQSRNFNQRFYNAQEASASNPVSAAFWHVAGLTSDAAHNLEAAGRGLVSLMTDGQARAAALNGLQQTWNHLPSVVIKGMRDFSLMSYGQQAGSLYKFGLENVATFGAGKIVGLGGELAYQSSAETLKWLAPKAGDLAFKYAQRTGLILNAIEDSGISSGYSAGDAAFATTDSVSVTGKRAIDLGKSYEAGVRNLYGDVPFAQRQYEALVNGNWVDGVADNIVQIGGKNTAIEAKFVEDWDTSLRNPLSQNGARPWALDEQQKVLQQAAKYDAAFDQVIYHTNDVNFAKYYTNAFSNAGFANFRFVITPVIK